MIKKILSVGIIILPFILCGQPFLNGRVDFSPEQDIEIGAFFGEFRKKYELSSDIEFIQVHESRSKSGMIHKKYKQTYKGLDIYKTFVTLHCNGNNVQHITGNLLPGVALYVPAQRNKAFKTESLPVNYVKNRYGKHDAQLSQKMIEVVVIDKSFPKFSGQYATAEKWIVTSEKLTTKHEVIISLEDGSIIFEQSLIRQGN